MISKTEDHKSYQLSGRMPGEISCGAISSYQRLVKKRTVILAATFLIVGISWITDLLTGPAMLSFQEMFGALISLEAADPVTSTIVWVYRLPTAVFAILIGASLGISGAEMQTILDNPLASPYTLGVSAAAGFGAALAIILGSEAFPLTAALVIPVSAFFFAVLCSMAVYGIARLKHGSSGAIILGGVALFFLFNSLVAFLQYLASEEQLQAIVFWMFGSLQGATWPKIAILGIVFAACCPFLALNTWRLTALRMGDERASGLGVNVKRLRFVILIIVSILTAVAVCFAGAIGFIGLVAPHLARIIVGEDQRFFLIQSALTGALLLSVASIGSKMIIPGTIFPIGIVTTFIGIPFFVGLILTNKRNFW